MIYYNRSYGRWVEDRKRIISVGWEMRNVKQQSILSLALALTIHNKQQRARSLFRTPERRADRREKKTIEVMEPTPLGEAMPTRDVHDPGILNDFGFLRDPPKATPSFTTPTSIHVFKGSSSDLEPRYSHDGNPQPL